jgi:hypothetical protein
VAAWLAAIAPVSRFIPFSCAEDSKIQREGSNRWKDGPSKASRRFFASLMVIAASGADPYFFLFFA